MQIDKFPGSNGLMMVNGMKWRELRTGGRQVMSGRWSPDDRRILTTFRTVSLRLSVCVTEPKTKVMKRQMHRVDSRKVAQSLLSFPPSFPFLFFPYSLLHCPSCIRRLFDIQFLTSVFTLVGSIEADWTNRQQALRWTGSRCADRRLDAAQNDTNLKFETRARPGRRRRRGKGQSSHKKTRCLSQMSGSVCRDDSS